MSTKYRLTDGMWIRNQFTGEQFCIDASNNEYIAGNINDKQILCRRDQAIRIHPPIQKPQSEPEPIINYDWITRSPYQTTGVTYVNPVTYTTTYNVSTASS
jgi:hypothetical protein